MFCPQPHLPGAVNKCDDEDDHAARLLSDPSPGLLATAASSQVLSCLLLRGPPFLSAHPKPSCPLGSSTVSASFMKPSLVANPRESFPSSSLPSPAGQKHTLRPSSQGPHRCAPSSPRCPVGPIRMALLLLWPVKWPRPPGDGGAPRRLRLSVFTLGKHQVAAWLMTVGQDDGRVGACLGST